jgi:3-oxoacyl-(acyl-carrier-protein) synthase
MRVPTPSEAAFLAVTAGVAAISTVTIVPDVIEEYQEQVAMNSDEPNPSDNWNNGFICGLGAGVVLTAKVIHDKVNNP